MTKPIDHLIKNMPIEIRNAQRYIDNPTRKFCPNCQKHYGPLFSSKEEAVESKDPVAVEQWISGICSDECWDEYLGA